MTMKKPVSVAILAVTVAVSFIFWSRSQSLSTVDDFPAFRAENAKQLVQAQSDIADLKQRREKYEAIMRGLGDAPDTESSSQ